MKSFVLTAAAVGLAACSSPPAVPVGAHPANPDAPAPPVRYAPVTAGTSTYLPVEPKPWLEQNEKVAPGGSAR